MAQTDIQLAQQKFMLAGGVLEMPLQQLRKAGLIDTDYVYREYPKMLRVSQGMQTVAGVAKETFRDIIVNTEDEEERVFSGGKTSKQLEEDRLGLLTRCRSMGVPADPTWSAVRLRRELGDALDAPAPGDNMAKLEAELASLKKMATMQAEIEALRAQLAKPAVTDEMEEIRGQLTTLGVKVDGRWSIHRLREELEKATGE